jgi:hypothetical protein
LCSFSFALAGFRHGPIVPALTINSSVPCPIPTRQAYHGAGNRLAPTAHFSEGGKTAYCNASLMQFALSAVMF